MINSIQIIIYLMAEVQAISLTPYLADTHNNDSYNQTEYISLSVSGNFLFVHTNKTAYANDRELPAQLTAQWAQTRASDEQLEAVTDALLLAMHDLRSVLVRKQSERLGGDED